MNTLLDDLENLVQDYQNEKIDTDTVISSLRSAVDYEEKLRGKVNLQMTKEEFDFIWTWLQDDLGIQEKDQTLPDNEVKLLRSVVKKIRKIGKDD